MSTVLTSRAEKTPSVETLYDEFNHVIPEDHFPEEGMSARTAEAMLNSEACTDCQPVMNLSSFVTTFTESELLEVARSHFLKNYIDTRYH